ncbi:MAG: 7TM diverse intracellular signaling domain-containing protein [Cytophagales bacterium]
MKKLCFFNIRIISFWALYMLFILASFGKEQEIDTVMLNNQFSFGNNILDNNKLLIFKDSQGVETSQSILSKTHLFQKSANKYPDNGGGESDFWVHFKAGFEHNCPDHLVDIHSPNARLLKLYKRVGDSLVFLGQTGAELPIFQRAYHYKNLLIGLEANRGAVVDYYVWVKKGRFCRFDFFLTPYNKLISYGCGEYLLLGIFYGLLIILSLFKLILYFSLKDKVFLSYVALLFSAGLKTLSEDRLGAQYLWQNYPEFSYWLGVHIAPWLVLFSFSWFVYSYLRIKLGTTTWCKWFITSMFLNLSIHLYCLFFLNDYLNFNTFFFLPYLFLTFISFSSYKKKKFNSLYFIIANILFVGIVIIDLLRHQRFVFGSPVVIFSFYIFMFFQSLFLALSIFDRLKMLVQEREKLLKSQLRNAQRILLNDYKPLSINPKLENTFQPLIETKQTKSQLISPSTIEVDFVAFLKSLIIMIESDLNDSEKRIVASSFEHDMDSFFCEIETDLIDLVCFPLIYQAFLKSSNNEILDIKLRKPNEQFFELQLRFFHDDNMVFLPENLRKSKHYLEELGGNLILNQQMNETFLKLILPDKCFKSLNFREVIEEDKEHLISDNNNNPSIESIEFLNYVNHIIEQNLDNPDLNVDAMVKELGMSRAQLYRRFSELIKISVKDYINIYRIKKAKEIIETENLSIKEVMIRVGFNNRNHFIKCFKDVIGDLPSNFKKTIYK